MNNTVRQYEYVMEGTEIREFYLAAWWEQCKCRKGVWLRLLLILTVEFLIIPKATVLIVAMVVVMFLVSGVYNYKVTAGLLEGQPWKTRIEGDRLQVEKGDYSETSCRNIKFIRRTKHLLMLGYLQSAKRPAWLLCRFGFLGAIKSGRCFLTGSAIRRGRPQRHMGMAWKTQQKMPTWPVRRGKRQFRRSICGFLIGWTQRDGCGSRKAWRKS